MVTYNREKPESVYHGTAYGRHFYMTAVTAGTVFRLWTLDHFYMTVVTATTAI
jgi:hypothetical protein